MTKFVYYGLAGGLALVIAASLIKKKPSGKLLVTGKVLSGPKTYVTAQGDLSMPVISRFGVKQADVVAANKLPSYRELNAKIATPGSIIQIPAGGADKGPGKFAAGTVQ